MAAALFVLLPSVSQAWSPAWLETWFDSGYAGYSGRVYRNETYYDVYWTAFKSFTDHAKTHRWADLYCVDMIGEFSGGWTYYKVFQTAYEDVPNIPPNGTEFGLDWAAALYNKYAAGFQGTGGVKAANRAALQVAMWEALYDGAPGFDYDIGSGVFHTAANPTILETAAGFLEDTQYTQNGGYYDDTQNLMGPTPEPGTLMLLGAGILGTGLATWRRRRKS